MSSKILFITQVFYPDEVSTANLFTDLCSALIKDGVDIEVWCAQPSYTNTNRQSRIIVYKGIKICYLASTNFRKTLLAGRLLNYLTFMTSVFFKLFLSSDKKPVMTHTTPPTLAIFLSIICYLKRRQYIQVLLDIFPEGLIRLGKMDRRNIFVRIWNYLFILSLKRSDRIITIGRDMKAWIEKLIENTDKLIYIPLWQDHELIFPMEFKENEIVIKYRLEDSFVVQYSGNMGLWNDMKSIGKAVMLKTHGVRYMFIGDGMRKGELIESMDMTNPPNVLMLPFQPRDSFRISLTACHASIVSLRKGLEAMAVPSKIYGIMAAGIPVIAMVPSDSEIAMIVKEEKCGIVVEPEDHISLLNAVQYLMTHEVERTVMGKNGRRAFEKKYTVKKIADHYKTVISGLR